MEYLDPAFVLTMQHTVVKDDHITGLCGSNGHGRRPALAPSPSDERSRTEVLGAPSEPARLATMRAGDQPKFEPRFSVGLEVQRDACTSVRRGRLVPVHLDRRCGGRCRDAIPARSSLYANRCDANTRLRSEHLARGQRGAHRRAMLEGRHLSTPAGGSTSEERRPPHRRNQRPSPQSVQRAADATPWPPQLEQTTNHDETIATVGFP